MLSEKEARVKNTDGAVMYEFRVPDDKLVAGPEGWDKLRMGIAVSWPGGPFGQPRQREAFLQNKTKAPHAGLSSSPEDWQLLSLKEYDRAMTDRRLQIAIDFRQPMDGKATIVIDNEQGRRVRNLISGQAMAAGSHRIVWDGANDNGDILPPGKYRWRSLSHPGLKPHYVFSFCDAPGSNHGTFHAAASNGRYVFLGTAVCEGGHEISQLEPDGKLVRGYIAPMGHGLSRVALAADEKFLYAAYDGTGWGQHVDRSQPDWSAENKITLVRFDLATGNVVDYSRTSRAALLRAYKVGPGSPGKAPDRLALAGLALFKGRLYLGDRSSSKVLEIDPATERVARAFPVGKSCRSGRRERRPLRDFRPAVGGTRSARGNGPPRDCYAGRRSRWVGGGRRRKVLRQRRSLARGADPRPQGNPGGPDRQGWRHHPWNR